MYCVWVLEDFRIVEYAGYSNKGVTHARKAISFCGGGRIFSF